MSNVVENKIVSMTFDNRGFVNGVKDTLAALGKLKESLRFQGAQTGIQEVAKATENMSRSFTEPSRGISNLSAGFVAMSTVAITAIASVTSKVLDLGATLTKSLGLEGAMSGFREYEVNMNSIQTILSNTKFKGSTLTDVNAALDELNHYADQTIYNFSEMARNIGTFTAAGVDLEKSTSAIKGIANLAALSGSNAQQASSAMYQLSQAMASGTVKLMDWNSVVNAGMGGELFKNALFETGKAMGKFPGITAPMKEWEEAAGSFRDTLETGWLTADVLTTTLGAMAGDFTDAELAAQGFNAEQRKMMLEMGTMGQAAATEVKTFTQLISVTKEAIGSGWAESWRIIIGDFEQAKRLFSDVGGYISKVVGDSSQARNDMLRGWRAFGGQDDVLAGLKNIFDGLLSVIRPIKEAFREIFPKKTAHDLLDMSRKFKEFTERLTISEGTASKVKDAFLAFFGALAGVKEVVKIAIGLVFQLVGALKPLGEILVDIAIFIANAFSGLGSALKGEDATDEVQNLTDKLDGLVSGVKIAVEWLATHLRAAFDYVADGASRFLGFLKELGGSIKDFGSAVADSFRTAVEFIKENVGGFSLDTFFNLIKTGVLLGIANYIREFLGLGKTLNEGIGDLFGGAKDAMDSLTGTLDNMQNQLKYENLLKIAYAVGILTLSMVALSFIDADKLATSLGAMAAGFAVLIATIAALSKLAIDPKTATKIAGLTLAMLGLGASLILMATAVKLFSLMDPKDLAVGLVGVAGALLVLAGAAKVLSGVGPSLIFASVGMVGMSLALIVLAGAVRLFSLMDPKDLAVGLGAAAAGLLIFAAAAHAMPNGPGMVLKAVGLIGMAVALNILAGAVALFAAMDIKTLAVGLGAVGVLLFGIGIAAQLIPVTLPLMAVGLIGVAIALGMMAASVAILGNMDPLKLVTGLLGLIAVLGAVTLAMFAMQGLLLGAAAMTAAALAIKILTDALVALSGVSAGKMAIALVGLAVGLTLLVVAGAALSAISPGLLAVGAALLLIGLGAAAFGVGALLIVQSLAILLELGGDAIKAFVALIGAVLKELPGWLVSVVTGLKDAIVAFLKAVPEILTTLGDILVALFKALTEAIPELVKTLGVFLEGVFELLEENIPKFVAVGFALLMALLEGLEDNAGDIANTAVLILAKFIAGLESNLHLLIEVATELLKTFLGGLADNVEEITAAATRLLTTFLNSITSSVEPIATAVTTLMTTFITEIGKHAEAIATAGTNAVVSFLGGLTKDVKQIGAAARELIRAFITEVGLMALEIADAGTDALITFLRGVEVNINRVCPVAQSVMRSFINCLYELSPLNAGVDAVLGFVKGILSVIRAVINAGVSVVRALVNAISGGLGGLGRLGFDAMTRLADSIGGGIGSVLKRVYDSGVTLGSNIVIGLINGINAWAQTVWDTIANIADGLVGTVERVLDMFSPSKRFAKLGGFIVQGLAVGMDKDDSANASAASMAEGVVDNFKKSLSALPDILVGVEDIQPVIAPVLDLTNVEEGAKTISDLFGVTPIKAESSFDSALGISEFDPRAAEPVVIETTKTVSNEFHQEINAPEQLTTGDIYKSTKSLFALAKKDLEDAA